MFIYMEGIRKSLLFGHPDQVGRGPPPPGLTESICEHFVTLSLKCVKMTILEGRNYLLSSFLLH